MTQLPLGFHEPPNVFHTQNSSYSFPKMSKTCVYRIRKSLDSLAEKLATDGPELLKAENLALLVSNAAETIGLGYQNDSTLVAINSSDTENDYQDSIILPMNNILKQHQLQNMTNDTHGKKPHSLPIFT